MHRTKRNPWIAAFVLAALAGAPALLAGGGKEEATRSFERLKALEGTWKGTAGADGGPSPGEIVYRVTAGGSAVIETMFPGMPHEMVSVYHMDGDRLVMTHYCASGNQPRMNLAGASDSELKFEFTGGTNVDVHKGSHIHGGTIRTLEQDVLEEEWVGWQDGKPAHVMKFHGARRAPSGAAPATR